MSGRVYKIDLPWGDLDQTTLSVNFGKSTLLSILWSFKDDQRFNAHFDELRRIKIDFTDSQWFLWEQLQLGVMRTEVRTFRLEGDLRTEWWMEGLPSQIDLKVPLAEGPIWWIEPKQYVEPKYGIAPKRPVHSRTVRFVASPDRADLPALDSLDMTHAHELGHLLLHRSGVEDSPLRPQSGVEKQLGVRLADPLDAVCVPDEASTADRFRQLVARASRAVTRIVDTSRSDRWRIGHVFDRCFARLAAIVFGVRSRVQTADFDVEDAPALGRTTDQPSIRGPNSLQMPESMSTCREPALV